MRNYNRYNYNYNYNYNRLRTEHKQNKSHSRRNGRLVWPIPLASLRTGGWQPMWWRINKFASCCNSGSLCSKVSKQAGLPASEQVAASEQLQIPLSLVLPLNSPFGQTRRATLRSITISLAGSTSKLEYDRPVGRLSHLRREPPGELSGRRLLLPMSTCLLNWSG